MKRKKLMRRIKSLEMKNKKLEIPREWQKPWDVKNFLVRDILCDAANDEDVPQLKDYAEDENIT